MMTEWKEYKLGELIQSISETYQFKPNEKVVFLNTSDILDGKFLTDSLSEASTLPGQAKKKIQKGDILYSEIRPANKRFALVDFDCDNYVVSTKLMVLRCNDYVDNRFIYNYLTSKEVLEYLQMVAEDRSGTFPQITFDIIANMDIELPTIEEQKQIGGILSSLDDKIELLRRENAILEAMAETLFRQWFVVEAKEDWEEKPLSFFGRIVCGKTPPKKESKYFGGGIPFIKIPDMHKKTFVFDSEDSLTEEGKLYQLDKTLPPFSIIVSCIATVGLVVLNAKEAQTNQQINSIIPYKDEYRCYLYLYLKNLYDELNAMASGGTATLNLNTGNFSKIPICYPGVDMLVAFHKQVKGVFEKIYYNQKQINTLIRTRDGLLPRLMNKEISM